MVLVGMDAVALFPSMSGKETGKIVRKRIKDSSVRIEGFNWRKAAVYIRINRGKLSKSGTEREVFKFLPFRKSNRGVQPKMGSTGMKAEIGSEKIQWIFPNKNPSDTIKKEMMGIVAEIAILVLWSNYAYKFGGKTYLQRRGGPIGQRPTMAAARLVMNEFMERYKERLIDADLKVTLLKVYVDDGRQVTTKLKRGMRYI